MYKVKWGFGADTESIIDLALELETDLIVLGSHGRSDVAGNALGSVVGSVAAATPCAIEIIRMSHSPSHANDNVRSRGSSSKIGFCSVTTNMPTPKQLLIRWQIHNGFRITNS